MPSLASFDAFVKSTGVKIRSSPNQIVNDAVRQTYFLSRMLKGRSVAQVVQSGQKIREGVQLSDVGTFTFVSPNEERDIQNVDSLTTIEVDWRFGSDHYAYTEAEVELNSGDPQTYHKNLLKGKRQACVTSTFNGMDTALFAAPSNADMEASSGKQPYSIPCFVTTDGLAPSGFTTVETVNPTTESGWRNQTATYDSGNKTDPDNGLLAALDSMFLDVKFTAPVGGPREYFENDLLRKMVIATNKDGRRLYGQLTRDSNDRLVPNGDMGWIQGQLVYHGIPVEYVTALNTALVNGGAAITAGAPWYYFLNLAYLFPIFHGNKYMSEKDPMTPIRQPDSRVVWKDTWYNLFCVSRLRQGLVSPA